MHITPRRAFAFLILAALTFADYELWAIDQNLKFQTGLMVMQAQQNQTTAPSGSTNHEFWDDPDGGIEVSESPVAQVLEFPKPKRAGK